MTTKDDQNAKPEKLADHYSEIGSAALRAALLCLRQAQDKPSGKKKAA